jgi:hypothetical protein
MLTVERPRRVVLLSLLVLALAQAQEAVLVRLTDAVGDTIDLAERDSLHLFPNTVGFQHAAILALPGPTFYARVSLAAADTTRHVFLRIMPGDLQRIRFLVNNREYVAGQQKSDSTAAQSLASFWQTVEEHPRQSMDAEPAGVPVASNPQTAMTGENRYNCTLHGATLGSIAGGCIGSHAGITYVRTENPECFPAYDVFHVDPCVFWGASCGITALGTGVGYAVGSKFDRDEPAQMTRLKESTNWRIGLAVGAFVPGLALGYCAYWITGISRYGVLSDILDVIENDENGWTTLPMAFTGLCIAVESATIGYRIGQAIDRRKAEETEAKRRALGR